MRQMDSMMNAMLQDPFPNLMPMHNQLMAPPQHNSRALAPFGSMGGFSMADPFGLPSMGHMFQAFVSIFVYCGKWYFLLLTSLHFFFKFRISQDAKCSVAVRS